MLSSYSLNCTFYFFTFLNRCFVLWEKNGFKVQKRKLMLVSFKKLRVNISKRQRGKIDHMRIGAIYIRLK